MCFYSDIFIVIYLQNIKKKTQMCIKTGNLNSTRLKSNIRFNKCFFALMITLYTHICIYIYIYIYKYIYIYIYIYI